MARRSLRAADLFCGAGGTSTGLQLAAQDLGLTLDLVAINHWQVAIDTHSANHPTATHLCESLDTVNPRRVVPGGRLKIMVAAPECTHHSNARGGRPMSDQSRASAWHIVRWADALYVENILIENVREFRDWGPLGANGRPLKRRKGETYQSLLTALRGLDYQVEERVLNAANYGDPTTRERLFILARRGNRKVRWPEPTHHKSGAETLFGAVPKWRAAREIIDWSVKGESIFNRKRPLSSNTMRRIAAGLRKFSGLPFVIGQQSQAAPRATEQPVPTVAAKGAIALVEPFILQIRGGNDPYTRGQRIDDPLKTITTEDPTALVEPFLLPNEGYYRGNVARSFDEPVPTVTQRGGGAVVEPFLVALRGTSAAQLDRSAHGLDRPAPTVTASGTHLGLAEPFVMRVNHANGDRVWSVDEPLRTVDTIDAWGVVEPYLVKYNGTGGAQSVDEPLDTVTAKDRFGLVMPGLDGYVLDIRFRMLQPRELARAMSFPDEYEFAGTREQSVRQIGNAVPVQLARALCRALLEN